jgi:DNA replication protein DnaC
LIIDDFGLKQLPKNSGEHLFEVIMRRYENRSTIMTSNRPLEEWGKLLGDHCGCDSGPFPAPRPDDCHHRQRLSGVKIEL